MFLNHFSSISSVRDNSVRLDQLTSSKFLTTSCFSGIGLQVCYCSNSNPKNLFEGVAGNLKHLLSQARELKIVVSFPSRRLPGET
jgi:hypothetical protein